MNPEQRGAAMAERFRSYKRDRPGAGEDFPEVTGALLEGGAWSSADYRGRILVLETGSYT